MIRFCSLYSGSSGNCLFISSGSTRILIDAGLSCKKITEALNSIGESPQDIDALLITHEHSDHIRGVGTFSKRFGVPVYANYSTWAAMEAYVENVSAENRVSFVTGEKFGVGDIEIEAFNIPHDAVEPVGYNFYINGRKITTATDIGHVNKNLLSSIENSELILLESNHDVELLKVGPYPWHLKRRILSDVGHLSNEMAGKVVAYLASKGTKRFLLGHLSRENNFPELAYQTVCNALRERNIRIGSDIFLDVALRDRVGQVIEL